MAKIVINTELNTKSFDKQIQNLQNKLDAQKATLQAISNSKPYAGQEESIKKYQLAIEKTTNSLNRLKEQQQKLSLASVSNIQYNASPKLGGGLSLTKTSLGGYAKGIDSQDFDYVAKNVKDLKNAFPDLGQKGEEAGEKSGKGFEKGIRSIKRFGLALLGVRGMFTIVRRATSSYLSEHEATANKLNAIWVALGNALGPIIEIIADGVLQLIGYLNVFLQALGFDVDLTKNMNKSTKAIQGTTSAMKELNRETYSFDEMNKQSKDTSVGGGGGGAGADSGFKMPELNEGIVKLLKDTAKFLKENWEWLTAIAGVLIGASWISKLTGAGGLVEALKELATVGVIAVGVNWLYNFVTGRNLLKDLKDIYDYLSKYKEIRDGIDGMNKKNTSDNKKWINNQKQEMKNWEKGSKEAKDYFDKLKSGALSIAEINEQISKNTTLLTDSVEWQGKYGNKIRMNSERMKDYLQGMADLYNQGLLTDKQEKIFFDTLKLVNGQLVDGIVQLDATIVTYDDAKNHGEKYTEVVKALNGSLGHTTASGRIFGDTITENVIGTLVSASKKAVVLKDDLNILGNVTATPEIKLKSNVNQIKADIQSLGTIIANIAGNFTITTKKFFGLAKGGIVNNPGKGVTMSGVITGEATNGAEGVIPMNNDEVMDMLGQKIARHIQINLTNNTMLDSRVIAREQTKIASDMNFLTNGRGV